MAVVLSSAYLAVRDVVPGQRLDPEAPDYDADAGAPVVGPGWSTVRQDAGWFTLHRVSDDLVISAYRANSRNERALWGVWGPLSLLDAIAASEPECMPAREAWARRTEPAVRAWLRRWRHWRIDGQVRGSDADGNPVVVPVAAGVVELVPEGVAIPDPAVLPLPWLLRADGSVTLVQAEAAVRVVSIYRPGLGITLAGHALHEVLEDEPERS